ncbi:MAG: hypothetical protein L3J31_08745 [Bacteroidales bacterium]|nr:hypothetical protein [Bacteroidales bacterium]
MQQQVISRFWFSDKQSVKVRNIDNAPNIEFILANKHKLYTREQLEKAWELAVDTWNSAPHPRFKEKSRNEVYAQDAPLRHPVDSLEIVQMFWIDDSKGSTYRRDGIRLKVAGAEHLFEVYTQDDRVDLEFRRKYVGCKFVIRYDPESLDQFVGLYEKTDNGLVFIAYAKPKRSHEQIPILMKPGDREKAREDYEVAEREYERDLAAVEALRARTGITPEKMIEEQDFEIKMGGSLKKEHRNKVESDSFLNRL